MVRLSRYAGCGVANFYLCVFSSALGRYHSADTFSLPDPILRNAAWATLIYSMFSGQSLWIFNSMSFQTSLSFKATAPNPIIGTPLAFSIIPPLLLSSIKSPAHLPLFISMTASQINFYSSLQQQNLASARLLMSLGFGPRTFSEPVLPFIFRSLRSLLLSASCCGLAIGSFRPFSLEAQRRLVQYTILAVQEVQGSRASQKSSLPEKMDQNHLVEKKQCSSHLRLHVSLPSLAKRGGIIVSDRVPSIVIFYMETSSASSFSSICL